MLFHFFGIDDYTFYDVPFYHQSLDIFENFSLYHQVPENFHCLRIQKDIEDIHHYFESRADTEDIEDIFCYQQILARMHCIDIVDEVVGLMSV